MDASSIGGALSVLLGFVLVNVGQKKSENEQEQDEVAVIQETTTTIVEGAPLESQDRLHMSMECMDSDEGLDHQITWRGSPTKRNS
jgi:hypothetical protein